MQWDMFFQGAMFIVFAKCSRGYVSSTPYVYSGLQSTFNFKLIIFRCKSLGHGNLGHDWQISNRSLLRSHLRLRRRINAHCCTQRSHGHFFIYCWYRTSPLSPNKRIGNYYYLNSLQISLNFKIKICRYEQGPSSEFMGKTFQAAQLTHERFLTIDHSCKIFF